MNIDGIKTNKKNRGNANINYWTSNIATGKNYKRIALFTILFLFINIINFSSLILPVKKANASLGPAVYFIPHQDDEMFLAGSIKEHIDAGRDVYVVMVTDGQASAARSKINGKDDLGSPVWCSLDGKYHNPTDEGYVPLTKKTFTAARNREFFESMKRLGVAESKVHFANQDVNEKLVAGESYNTGWSSPKYIDGALTKTQATSVIQYYFNLFGAGSYKGVAAGTGSPYSPGIHADHVSLYTALRDFQGVSDKRFYTDVSTGPGVVTHALSKVRPTQNELSVFETKAAALDNYYTWNPSAGRFAVGEHSVKATIDIWKANGAEYYFADTSPPNNVTNLIIKAADSSAIISWVNPTNSDFAGVKIVRKSGSYPTSINDGTLVFTGNKTTYTNTGLTNGLTYYYKVFSYDTVLNYSSGATALVALNVDKTAPTFSNIVSTPSSTTVKITWTTNEPATTKFEYGTTASYGSASTINNTKTTSHAMSIGSLEAETLYHFRVLSTDSAGNAGISTDQTFTTTAIPDTTSPVVSSVESSPAAVSAKIAWATDEPANSQIEYGLTTDYGQSTTLVTTLVEEHIDEIRGLTPATSYHFRVKSADAASNSVTSGDYTFTTLAVDATPPIISAIVAENPDESSIVINWTTNEPSTSQIAFSEDSSFSNLTTLDEELVTEHSVFITDLDPATTYNYRVKSIDESNNLATSSASSFKTANMPDVSAPIITSVTASAPTSTTVTINWKTNEISSSQVEFGEDTDYGTGTPIDLTNVLSHSVKINGLTPDTTYHFIVRSIDLAGNEGVSADGTFSTNSDPDAIIATPTPDLNESKLSTIKNGVTLTLLSDGEIISDLYLEVNEIPRTSRLAPENFSVWRAYSISAYDADGYAVTDDFLINVKITVDDSFNGKNFLIKYWDGYEWASEGISESKYDAVNHTVSFNTTHFSEFGIFAGNETSTGKAPQFMLPVTGSGAVSIIVNFLISLAFTFLIIIAGRLKPLLKKNNFC